MMMMTTKENRMYIFGWEGRKEGRGEGNVNSKKWGGKTLCEKKEMTNVHANKQKQKEKKISQSKQLNTYIKVSRKEKRMI